MDTEGFLKDMQALDSSSYDSSSKHILYLRLQSPNVLVLKKVHSRVFVNIQVPEITTLALRIGLVQYIKKF